VVADLAQEVMRPLGGSVKQREHFAALIRAEAPAILASYAESLEALRSPVMAEPGTRDQAMTNAAEIIADVAVGVEGGDIRADDRYAMLTWMIGEARPETRLSPADLLRAAAAFFDVAVSVLARHVQDDPALLPCFTTGVLALNESINRRIRETTLAYTGYLLERVDQAHIDERRRIARDLHDRLGEGMSVALRQLELHELNREADPAASPPRATMAKDAIVEAMRRLRAVTSGLRQDSLRSLEKALIQYIDSVAPDIATADVRLRVSGDETWVPPAVIDEAFLIIREAIRNALKHGSPQLVLIGVALAPHELYAWVEDDGCGFVNPAQADPVSAGTGLASMRERAALIGGRLAIASSAGQGAHVELLVPLPGCPR
jgi:signal transduction histidine kinase